MPANHDQQTPLATLTLLPKLTEQKADSTKVNHLNQNMQNDATQNNVADSTARVYLAKWSDLPSIVAIYNANIASKKATADLYPVTIAEREAWFRLHLDDANRPIYVVKSACGEVIAWGSFSHVKDRPAYHISSEISIYVADTHHRRGIGFAFTNWLLAQAPSLNIQQVVALIFAHNTASLALFKWLGFEQWGILPNVCDMGDFIASVHILGRSVGYNSLS